MIDADSFDEKYNQYSSMIFKLSMVYLGHRDDAEDATQEAFIRLVYKSPSFSDIEHEKRWLIRTTINICKDKIKGFWRKNVVSLSGDFYGTTMEAESFEFADMILKLPLKYRVVIHLYYYENYTIAEISKIMDIGISATKMRLKRGRELLKIDLEDTYG